MTFVYTLLLGLLCVLVQMFIPGISTLGSARPDVPVLAVIFSVLQLRGLHVFVITALVGLYIDLLSPNRLGVSVIGLSVVAALVLTQTAGQDNGKPLRRVDFQMLIVLVGTFINLSLSYLFYRMQIWSGSTSPGDGILITYGSILNALISPLLFALFSLPLRLFGLGNWKREEYTGYAAR